MTPAAPANPIVLGAYRLVPVWQTVTPELATRVIDFWLREGALPDRTRAEGRIAELAYVIEKEDGIAGVSTAHAGPAPKFGGVYYFYRMFIRPGDRVHGLAQNVTLATARLLESRAAAGGPAGVLVAAENPKLASRALMQRLLGRHGWSYAGLNRIGQPTWEYRFRHS